MPAENPLSSPNRLRSDDEAQIAPLAYRFYCEEGCPEGRAEEHWLRGRGAGAWPNRICQAGHTIDGTRAGRPS
jgi:hypothetical protein